MDILEMLPYRVPPSWLEIDRVYRYTLNQLNYAIYDARADLARLDGTAA
jgi:hypothetical protein